MSLKNKVAVVTGAGGTLCSTLSIQLAKAGVKVVLIGRTLEKLEKVAKVIKKNKGTYLIEVVDVNNEEALTKVAIEIVKKFKKVDYLINGAGGNNALATTKKDTISDDEFSSKHKLDGFFDLSIEAMKQVLETNTIGTVVPCRVFGKIMAKNGGGAIVNFASMNSYKPLTKNVSYAMAKAGIYNFTEWLANYLAPAHIRVNAIAPGFFVNERSIKILRTPDGGLSERGKHVYAHTPMKRFGEAIDLWGTLEWLLDDDKSNFVTGVTIPVDGGFIAHPGI
ncbi:MAG: SDR family oxidoreductase [Bacilli bacterium]|nr:SDR family oxidoreductase [Bacilli bacterium]